MSDSNDTNDAPATEQFDLTMGMEFTTSVDEVRDLAADLRDAESLEAESEDTERLAEWVAALKELESAAEDVRKDVFEDELDDRTDVDDEIGDLVKRQGHNKYLFDEDDAVEAIEAAGGDPRQVMSVKASSFVEVANALGVDPDEHVGRAEYEYFRRRS